MDRSYDSYENTALVAIYSQAAEAHELASSSGDFAAANTQQAAIAAVYRELRKRGLSAQQLLLGLLCEKGPAVRAWVGAHALEFEPETGVQILEALAATEGLPSVSARYTLREWRQGTLVFS